MANSKFLEKMRGAAMPQIEEPEKQEIKVELPVEEPKQGKIESTILEEIDEEEKVDRKIEENDNNTSFNINNIPSMPSLMTEEQKIEEPEIEAPKISKIEAMPASPTPSTTPVRRGRKTAEQVEAERKEAEKKQMEKTISNMMPTFDSVPKTTEVNYTPSSSNFEGSSIETSGICNEVLQFVCKSTIRNFSTSHSSKIYTSEFAKSLLEKYVDNNIEQCDIPLFRALISEIINSEEKDPYLGDLTSKVLKYILEN